MMCYYLNVQFQGQSVKPLLQTLAFTCHFPVRRLRCTKASCASRSKTALTVRMRGPCGSAVFAMRISISHIVTFRLQQEMTTQIQKNVSGCASSTLWNRFRTSEKFLRNMLLCVISDFRRELDENCVLLGHDAVSSGNFYRRFGTTYRSQLQGSTLEAVTDRLSRNVGKKFPLLTS
jgi:hypothetical protein